MFDIAKEHHDRDVRSVTHQTESVQVEICQLYIFQFSATFFFPGKKFCQ